MELIIADVTLESVSNSHQYIFNLRFACAPPHACI